MTLPFPQPPLNVGDTFTSGGITWVWDGDKWVTESPGWAGVYIASAPPATAANGDLWWDNTMGDMFIYYDDGTSTQWVTASTNAGPMGPPANRNYIDNALFNVQQRGTGPWTISGVYTADRWATSLLTDTATFAIGALDDANRAAIGDEAAVYGLVNTFTGSSAASSYNQVVHRIENVRRLAGKTVTVSFWAWAVAPVQLGVSLDQVFGTGGSPSASVTGAGQAVSLTTVPTRYSLLFALPSAAGKTFGSTAGSDYTQLCFWYSSSATYAPRPGIGVQSGIIALWGIQLEEGMRATALEKLPPEAELARCLRFFQPLSPLVWTWLGGSFAGYSWALPVAMRAAPTLSYTDLVGNASRVSVAVSGAQQNNIVITSGGFSANVRMLMLDCNVATLTGATWGRCVMNLSADL